MSLTVPDLPLCVPPTTVQSAPSFNFFSISYPCHNQGSNPGNHIMAESRPFGRLGPALHLTSEPAAPADSQFSQIGRLLTDNNVSLLSTLLSRSRFPKAAPQ